MRKITILLIMILFFTLGIPGYSQSREGATLADLFTTGIRAFDSGDYQLAIQSFREITLNSSGSAAEGRAYYWLGRSYAAADRYDLSLKNIDHFLSQFPEHEIHHEGLYQKGRVLFLQGKYEASIEYFYRFLDAGKPSENTANAYFWIGESLYNLGQLEDSEKIFNIVVTNYPGSFKIEAARYRLSLIKLKYRETELLDLLKMSHEEYLRALEEFQTRERTYEQAVTAYQKRISELTNQLSAAQTRGTDSTDSSVREEMLTQTIEEKNREIESLKAQISQLARSVDALRESLENNRIQIQQNSTAATEQSSTTSSQVTIQGGDAAELLQLKEQALSLQQYYLNWLSDNSIGGQ